MTQSNKQLFQDHARQFALAVKSDPSLTLSHYCRKNLISYSGLRKWMTRNNISTTDIKREVRRGSVPSPQTGSFIQMQPAPSSRLQPAAGQVLLHDVSIGLGGGATVHMPSVSIESLSILLEKLLQSCSH